MRNYELTGSCLGDLLFFLLAALGILLLGLILSLPSYLVFR